MSFLKIEVKEISIGANKPSIELSRRLTHLMLRSVMQTFESEGPGWSPLKAKTIKQRLRAGFGAGPILNRKRGNLGLRGGIIEAPSETEAVVGTRAGIAYDKIHQFGGVINRVTKPGSVNLRLVKGKSGNLLRQKDYKNLAVFGKKSHKLTKTVSYAGGKSFQIKITARPFLKFTEKLVEEIKAEVKNFFEGK